MGAPISGDNLKNAPGAGTPTDPTNVHRDPMAHPRR